MKECLDAGYTSVMFDGSRLPFAENADLTAQAVQMAKACGASCEGELGTVGGKEDSLTAEAGAYTDPAEAAEFVRCSGVDSLAVAVGTAHGVYHTAPKLDLARIPLIQAQADLPLVLHGASGRRTQWCGKLWPREWPRSILPPSCGRPLLRQSEGLWRRNRRGSTPKNIWTRVEKAYKS